MKAAKQAILIGALLILAGAGFAQADSDETHAPCSPIIKETGGNVKVICITVASQAEAKLVAQSNLQTLVDQLRGIVAGKTRWLIPALERYRAAPSKERWDVVHDEAQQILDLVKAATTSVLLYDPGLKNDFGPQLDSISETIMTRGENLHSILDQSDMPDTSKVTDWINRLQSLTEDTLKELEGLQKLLQAAG